MGKQAKEATTTEQNKPPFSSPYLLVEPQRTQLVINKAMNCLKISKIKLKCSLKDSKIKPHLKSDLED